MPFIDNVHPKSSDQSDIVCTRKKRRLAEFEIEIARVITSSQALYLYQQSILFYQKSRWDFALKFFRLIVTVRRIDYKWNLLKSSSKCDDSHSILLWSVKEIINEMYYELYVSLKKIINILLCLTKSAFALPFWNCIMISFEKQIRGSLSLKVRIIIH